MKQAGKWLGWVFVFLSGVGCRSLDRFNTHPGEAYCGSLIGRDHISTGFEDARWSGVDGASTLALTLDASELFKAGGVPAVVTSDDAAFGPCAPDKSLFEQAGLRTIDRALGDRLSSMRLGEDHEEDVVTFVDSSCSGSMVAILSLVQNGDVELRLLRPAAESQDSSEPPSDASGTPRFGLFVLKKTKEGCGF